MNRVKFQEDDVEKRKRMALVAFNKLTKIWKNIGKVSEKVRISLYNAYVYSTTQVPGDF